ncbi:SdrD B-like domain-containing protein [Bacillus cereus]|uniref:SdrD B-like domain-containing protein n=1 Tax=Bacillus cereus TaxID=1396 RepID=UPI000BEC63F0|nr:SdrD B-like domain-containing protein [Bacillus cereus]PEF68199.1 hypothetical protein CON35_08770 [Bacillus cereus]
MKWKKVMCGGILSTAVIGSQLTTLPIAHAAGNTGSISDTIWEDNNQNGRRDAGELGIPNIKMDLFKTTGELSNSTVTDNNGHYLFKDVPNGYYYLKLNVPSNYNFYGAPHFGTDMLSDYLEVKGNNLTGVGAGLVTKKPILIENIKTIDKGYGKLTFTKVGDKLQTNFEKEGYGISFANQNWSVSVDGKKVYSFNEKTGVWLVAKELNKLNLQGNTFTIQEEPQVVDLKTIDKGYGKLYFKKNGNKLQVNATNVGYGISFANQNWSVYVDSKKVYSFNEKTGVWLIAEELNKLNLQGNTFTIQES